MLARIVCGALVLVACAPGPAWAQGVPLAQAKDLVVVLKGEKVYHETACPLVAGRQGVEVTVRRRAQHLRYKAHDCATAIKQALETDPTRLVWVDLKTKRYHLAGCSLVGTPRAQMGLEHARAKYQACNACKPPK